ncbi:FHA domain protein (macronuclear) [Tetrahymena thermophila SB210]|uniref:FHA domain protein n=1 Tax=Tetrahymena thermophila (strain SB210) TaxID=312017 RepID=I7MH53_TETTS|nr:FHA domain protein [Tetrahymena thermophila SB210]EAR86084.2 FHA domain protein [Tetrahymena thermophila SB210]|eukprot:XP_976679.2 FHA domain protein [Tetrahymena thermophila SB210]
MKRYILKLIDGKDSTTIQKWKLKKDNTYIIGRSDKVEIPIQQESISRKHAEICVLENSATIKDLGSANGTFIDDKIAKHNQIIFLKNGTKIYLGDSPNYLIVKEKERKAKVSEQSLQEQAEEQEEVEEQQTKEQKKLKKKKESKQKESDEDDEQEIEQKKEQKKKKSSKEQQEDRERSRSYEKEKQKSSKNEQKEPQTQEQKPNTSVSKDLNASDKRKLLWQNKKTDNLESKAQIYGKVEANAEETNKFFKLLGFKSSADGKSSTGAKVQNYFITKSGSDKQTMINDLESQYNEGMKRKNGNKGGLGYN